MTFTGEETNTGRTTRQMQTAPQGALYVWHNVRLGFPRNLARELGRTDLVIVSPLWLSNGQQWFGRVWPGVVVDHAAIARFTPEQQRGLEIILTRMRTVS